MSLCRKINRGRTWAQMRILQNGCILTILIWQNVLKRMLVQLLIYFFQSRHLRIVFWTVIHRGTAAVIPITWSVSSHVWDMSVFGVTLKCKPRFVVLEGAWNLEPTGVLNIPFFAIIFPFYCVAHCGVAQVAVIATDRGQGWGQRVQSFLLFKKSLYLSRRVFKILKWNEKETNVVLAIPGPGRRALSQSLQ